MNFYIPMPAMPADRAVPSFSMAAPVPEWLLTDFITPSAVVPAEKSWKFMEVVANHNCWSIKACSFQESGSFSLENRFFYCGLGQSFTLICDQEVSSLYFWTEKVSRVERSVTVSHRFVFSRTVSGGKIWRAGRNFCVQSQQFRL